MKLLVPIVGVVFVAFLVTGLALPVLPLHIRSDLGLGTFIVGLVAGAQFGAALLCVSRPGPTPTREARSGPSSSASCSPPLQASCTSSRCASSMRP